MIIAYVKTMNQDDVRKLLAQNIKRRRKELGITQSKLTEYADISEPHMNDIERCQTWISDKTLAKLAGALKLDLHELFMQEREKKDPSGDKKDIHLLFQKHKKEMHSYIERTFESMIQDMYTPHNAP